MSEAKPLTSEEVRGLKVVKGNITKANGDQPSQNALLATIDALRARVAVLEGACLEPLLDYTRCRLCKAMWRTEGGELQWHYQRCALLRPAAGKEGEDA